ncbi:DUF2267 domain-containing protein [Halobium palmae]|uniref:DUF2267 domain-containing protein n=1 Tax=Halobium palmae TaxID=1776492 RepID=A0ABD5RXW5_9EURY
MDYDDFIGNVQQYADYADGGEAESATRSTLTTLGERVTELEAEDLAAQLPPEIGRHLTEGESQERFDCEDFLDRVADRGERDEVASDPENAAKAVAGTLQEAVGGEGELADVVNQLPQDEGYGGLFPTRQ